MAFKKFFKRHENFIWAGILLVIICVFTAVRYDYYFDLNDDVLMKDILAGVYTGTPEGHNIQMLWPVSAFISLLYRMAGALPWYGIFLCVCHYGCLFIIARRSLTFCRTTLTRLCLILVEGFLMAGLLLEHLVFAQYTVTCTLLAGTAVFLFYTTQEELSAGKFIIKNISSILLVSVAYLIRSEMLLLVLPLICAAGAARWGYEEKIFCKVNFIKYLTTFGGIILGIVLGQAAHMIAYSTPEWKTFTEYFDNRTELYDFQVLPEYQGNETFYESVGLTESERDLLENYNFGLNEEINEKLVGRIAEYAAANRSAQKPFMQNLKESLGEYIYRLSHGPGAAGSDYPWNYVIILGYISTFAVGTLLKKGQESMPRPIMENPLKEIPPDIIGYKRYLLNAVQIGWKLAFLFTVRTVLWMYIIMRDRIPVRISHSLYLMELCILGAMLFMEWKRLYSEKTVKYAAIFCGTAFAVLSILILPKSVIFTDDNSLARAEFNRPYQQLYSFITADENKNNFYFIDVYTSVNYAGNPNVSYSQKMFENVDNSLVNYDIMGGWASKSPLYRRKLSSFSISTMEEALLHKEGVYFVSASSNDLQWLYDYYGDHQAQIEITPVTTLAEAFTIYDIKLSENGA